MLGKSHQLLRLLLGLGSMGHDHARRLPHNLLGGIDQSLVGHSLLYRLFLGLPPQESMQRLSVPQLTLAISATLPSIIGVQTHVTVTNVLRSFCDLPSLF